MEGSCLVETEETEKSWEEDIEGRPLSVEASRLMARGIVHELNNVLMGIGGRTEMALAELAAEHPVSRYLRGISEGVDRASELTAELRRCLVSGEVNREGILTDMNSLVQKAAGLIQRADKGLCIELTEAESPPVSLCDGHLALKCILMIMLEAACVSKERPLRVKICETGNGEAASISVIFSVSGVLSCGGVLELMEMMGGKLSKRSCAKDQSVVLSFPPLRQSENMQEVPLTPSLALSAKTVLLVDDEDTVLEVEAGLLQRLGYEVIKAHDGRRALQLFETYGDKIDLVILDLVMSGMDGIETIQRLRSMDPKVKLILATGYKESLESSVMEKVGCPVLQKPLKTSELVQCLKKVLG